MKKLPVDVAEIAVLVESTGHEDQYYLDLHTGQIVILPADFSFVDLEDTHETARLPEWEKELVPIAREIAAGNERYVSLPEFTSDEAYEQIAEFARAVPDAALRERLSDALDGAHPFQRFKNVLLQHLAEEKHWLKFKDHAMAEYVRQWLHEIGIEPTAP